jgi:hypothetical protein
VRNFDLCGAGPGWDPATGLGSPSADQLVNYLKQFVSAGASKRGTLIFTCSASKWCEFTGNGEGYGALDWVGRDGSAVRALWEELPCDLQGSKSRPKAAMLMATTMALQEAKKSHAALERNESLRVMTVDPLLVFCIYPCSVSVFCCRREAGQRGLAPGN